MFVIYGHIVFILTTDKYGIPLRNNEIQKRIIIQQNVALFTFVQIVSTKKLRKA